MPDIEFRGYSGDCLVMGRLELPRGVRLTDFLNAAESLKVRGMTLHALDDARMVPGDDQLLEVDELWAIEPTDPPGQSDMHVPTRALQVEFTLEPYVVSGYVHSLSTSDPIDNIYRRKSFVPVTDAQIRFTFGGRELTREAPVMIVNRHHASNIQEVHYEKSLIDELGLAPVDPHAKDMTPEITFDREG